MRFEHVRIAAVAHVLPEERVSSEELETIALLLVAGEYRRQRQNRARYLGSSGAGLRLLELR